MKTLISVVIALTLVVPAYAHAQTTGGLRPSWKACMESHLLPGQMDCIDTEISYQDVRLNRNYKRTMARLAPAQRGILRTSQREWLRTYEKACSRRSADMLASMSCILVAITNRADWLETYRAR